jgi:hypothetical protein
MPGGRYFPSGIFLESHVMDQYPSYPKWVYIKRASGGVEAMLIETPDGLKKITESWAESPAGPFVSASDPRKVRRSSKRAVVGGG